MAHTPPRRLTNGVVDIPLPGSFDVLTVQMNATVYPRAQTGKFVIILRDPITQVEIARLGGHEQRLAEMLTDLDTSTSTVLRQALYMGGLDAASRPTEATPPI